MSRLIHGMIMAMATAPLFGQTVNVNISGGVSDDAGTLISGAAVKLVTTTGVTATTGQDGSFSLKSGSTAILKADPKAPLAEILDGGLFLSIPEKIHRHNHGIWIARRRDRKGGAAHGCGIAQHEAAGHRVRDRFL